MSRSVSGHKVGSEWQPLHYIHLGSDDDEWAAAAYQQNAHDPVTGLLLVKNCHEGR